MLKKTPLSTDSKLINNYVEMIRENSRIDPELYEAYNVKRGLRNADGTGVLVGLTRIGCVHGYVVSESEKVAVPGRLIYRGINVEELVSGCHEEGRMGFEECAYLLLFGRLPNRAELAEWNEILDQNRRLSPGFKSTIIRSPGKDVMNGIARAVLRAYLYDPNPDDISIPNVLRQSIALIARFPIIAAYVHQAKDHHYLDSALVVRSPRTGKSTAENFLSLCRENGKCSHLEATLLDLCLILHAEHGGGNNSAFTTRVVSSAYTDTYSAVTSALLSLKGPRHGGANLSVITQMDEIKKNVRRWDREGDVADYLRKILKKKAGDGTGLIYGLGHAVYTISDPRTDMLREKARELAAVNNRQDEFALYELIERLGPVVFNENREKPRKLCVNVDFYSGFVYDMLGIPSDLYTPIFAISRIVGWCAHRMEELINGGPIIRPAFKSINDPRSFVPMADRDEIEIPLRTAIPPQKKRKPDAK